MSTGEMHRKQGPRDRRIVRRRTGREGAPAREKDRGTERGAGAGKLRIFSCGEGTKMRRMHLISIKANCAAFPTPHPCPKPDVRDRKGCGKGEIR